MAELKRQTFQFSTGKQIKINGTGIGITRCLEVGEVTPTIFRLDDGKVDGKPVNEISNPFQLTKEELLELADFLIKVCMDFKDNVRKYDLTNPKVFNKETFQMSEDGKEDTLPKKEGKQGTAKENSKEKSGNKNKSPDTSSGLSSDSKEDDHNKNSGAKQLTINSENEK